MSYLPKCVNVKENAIETAAENERGIVTSKR